MAETRPDRKTERREKAALARQQVAATGSPDPSTRLAKIQRRNDRRRLPAKLQDPRALPFVWEWALREVEELRRAEEEFLASFPDTPDTAAERYEQRRHGATVRNRLMQTAVAAQKIYQDQHIGDVPNKITLEFKAVAAPDRHVTDAELVELGLEAPSDAG